MITPIPIPKATRDLAEARGYKVKVISAPNGDLLDDKIRPVEALVGIVTPDDEPPYPELHVLLEIDENDFKQMEKHGRRLWVTFMGHVVPFSCSAFDPEDAENNDADD